MSEPSYPVTLRRCLETGMSVVALGAPEVVVAGSGTPPCHVYGALLVVVRVPVRGGTYTHLTCAACDFVSRGLIVGGRALT